MTVHISAKAGRLLTSGAVRLLHLDEHVLVARVVGDSATWLVRCDRDTGWSCTCPARRTCSHIAALELVATGRRAQPKEYTP